jgi:large subunit ribosomal protein L22
MKAFLKNYRQSPRKVELVTGLIKGKRVAEAFTQLNSLPKRASSIIHKLLTSAVSNAKQAGISEDNLYVQNVTVNKGIVIKRMMPRARGSASRINKRTSHVALTLVEKITAEKKLTEKKIVKKYKSKKLEPKN